MECDGERRGEDSQWTEEECRCTQLQHLTWMGNVWPIIGVQFVPNTRVINSKRSDCCRGRFQKATRIGHDIGPRITLLSGSSRITNLTHRSVSWRKCIMTFVLTAVRTYVLWYRTDYGCAASERFISWHVLFEKWWWKKKTTVRIID